MSLAGTTNFNGMFITNPDLLLDTASTIISGGDWSIQFYYFTGQITINNRLFYVSDDSIGVVAYPDRKLYLYFNAQVGIQYFPLGITLGNTLKCYTFVRSGNNFYAYENGIKISSLLNVFTSIVLPVTTQYLCICPTQPNIISATNFISFYNLSLSDSYVLTYYQYIFNSSAPNLLLNIRGGMDYTNNGNIVETDLTKSSLVSVDLCSNTGGI